MTEDIKTKKREAAEDFVGWISPDGNLEVTELIEKSKHSKYKVICKICSQDRELFPLGYFISEKYTLKRGTKPCGCSKNPKHTADQCLILARRAAKDRFIVHSIVGELNGCLTKLDCECLIDGHKWIPTVNNVVNHKHGCYVCGIKSMKEKQRLPEQEALDRCKAICDEMKYTVIGFDNYENTGSKFIFVCPKHGQQKVNYHKFVNGGRRCKGCSLDKRKETSGFYGYYPHRKDEKDYLYVLNFDNQYIKVGRTFQFDTRVGQLKGQSGYNNIELVTMLTERHKTIWDLEQDIHNQLRQKDLDFTPSNWYSMETFKVDALPVVLEILSVCGFEKIC